MKRVIPTKLLIILFFQLFIFCPKAFPGTGWLTTKKKNDIHYKPFVDVKKPENKLVIFITENGKVYKGRCRKKKATVCRITPSKKFYRKEEIRFIVLKLIPFFAPEVVKSGVIK